MSCSVSTSALPQPVTNAPADERVADLRLVTVLDSADMLRIAEKARDMYVFWDERVRADPLRAFIHLFAHPDNVVFMVKDGGVLSVSDVIPGWRAKVHILAWDRAAMRSRDLLRTAALAAMRAKDLLVLDGVTPAETPERPLVAQLALANARRCGMTEKGRIKRAYRYNGVDVDGVWFQITRDELTQELPNG